MASTSSNTSPVSNNNVFRYDVFLSFRDETRHAFTDHLYTALLNAGLTPFRDNDDIDRGEDLQPEIERGIRESRASIVVLSDKYATSRWCLDELCLILEQRTKRNHFVLPIFYHVDPSHVRKQEESFEINVKCNTKWTEDNVERWKAALKKVGNMAGEVPSGPETKFLKKVVGIIEKRLDLKEVYRKANLVGMDTRRKEVDHWLERSNAQILAVWGMGGIGKTTLARHTVYSNWENFVSLSILEDIGSKSAEQFHELQQKLLRDILQGKKRKIPSVWQGTCKIENALKTEKALIVLDNIVEPSQLFVLLGTGTETQCKIIITTRESNPHKWFKSTSWRCQELEMKSLDKNDSLELLSRHAFGSKAPTECYDHLVEKALRYCQGNPLALEVLGSSLSQNNKQLWESRLNSFEKELHAGIFSVLIGSYESLPLDSDREMFLHIACFFVGKDIDYVVKILEPDYSALSGIENLFKSCLLSVSPNKKLMMHRMLQEMARTIVYKESPKDPAKRSRVWRDKESYDMLKKGKGSENIEGLALDINLLNQGKEQHVYKSLDLNTESFTKMDKLKLLQLNWVGLNGTYENFSEQLKWLCWIGFRLRAIPSDLCMENLVAIDMSYSCLEEFEPPADLLSLKILNLRSSKDLREIRNIYRLRYLEILILWDCRSLTHVNLGDLTCLAILNITGCKKLCTREEIISTQQASFLLPPSLEQLYLMNCNLSDTDYFPLTFKDQPLLIYLNLVNSPFELLPSYNYLKRLRVLDVSGCSDLKELLHLPSTLAELYIYYCNSLNIVTFESHRFTLQEFGYEGSVNLCEVEGLFKLLPVTKLEESDLKHMTWLKEYQDLMVCLVGDAELTKGRSSCVQMLYEFNIMSTSLPNIKNSNMMTDTDYMYTSQSTLLSFKVPACPEHRRLEGLIISFQYTAHGEEWVWFAKISTPSDVNLMYNPRVFGKPDEVGMWSSYWPIGKSLQIEETVTVSIVVIKGLLDIHWCGASLVYTDEAANEHLQENRECVAILGEDFSEFQLSTGDYYLCRRDFFELMEAGKLAPDWFRILVDDKIDYTEVGGWRMTGKPEHQYQSYTEVKTIRCIMYGPEMVDIYKIAELSKSSLVDKTMESTSELSKAIPKAGGAARIAAVGAYPKRPGEPPFQTSDNQLSLADFDAVKVVGKGNGGIVRLVQHKWTGQFFALKVIQMNVNESACKQIAQEFKIYQSCQCTNVVVYYQSFYDNGVVSIILEYMDGGSLADFLRTVRSIPEPNLAAICKQVLKGLWYLHHEKHIIHRDIKPSNLLINHQGEVKITDFGVSVILASTSGLANTFVGTYNYMSPERIIGGNYGYRSDIWSLGLVLLECVTGCFPYSPPQPGKGWVNVYELMETIVGQPPPRASPEQFSPQFCSFIEACMQKDPKDRPSANELMSHPFINMFDDMALDLASYFTELGSSLGPP